MGPYNIGVVAGFSDSTGTTYKDGDGRTVAAKVATSSYQSGQQAPSIGRGQQATIRVHAEFDGGMTTWSLYARTKGASDGNSFWEPTEICLQRLDGSDSAGVEKSVTSADFTGKDGEACDVAFTTGSAFGAMGELEILVKGNQAPGAGDVFYASIEVA